MNTEECKQQLLETTQRLNPVLNSMGYVFEDSGSGVSSGGLFAAGVYVNGEKKVGLIYRAMAGLGSVNYEYGNGELAISHSDLMRHLGKKDISKLRYDTSRFLSYSRDAGDTIDALLYDIENFGKDFLTSSDEQFATTLKAIPRRSSITPDSKVMVGILIGMVVGGIIGYILQSLGWGLISGAVIGLAAGIYLDLQKGRKISGQ